MCIIRLSNSECAVPKKSSDQKISGQQVTAPRRATNVTLPVSLLREARDLNINVSKSCERGLAADVYAMKSQQWLRDNRAAMDAWNDHVEQHGLPLAEFRQF